MKNRSSTTLANFWFDVRAGRGNYSELYIDILGKVFNFGYLNLFSGLRRRELSFLLYHLVLPQSMSPVGPYRLVELGIELLILDVCWHIYMELWTTIVAITTLSTWQEKWSTVYLYEASLFLFLSFLQAKCSCLSTISPGLNFNWTCGLIANATNVVQVIY